MSEIRYPRRFVWDGSMPCEYIEQLGPNERCVCVAPGQIYNGVSRGAEAVENNTAGGLWVETFDHRKPRYKPESVAFGEVDKLRAALEEFKAAKVSLKANLYDEQRHVAKLQSENAKLRAEVERLTEQLKTKQMEIDLRGEPAVIDEARWLEERNAGAESFAKKMLDDDGRGVLNEGLCRDAIEMVRGLRKERDELRAKLQWTESALAGERGRVEGLKEGCERLKRDLLESECRTGRVEDLRESDCEKLLAFHAELRRQVNEACLRLDYATADRIATLIGDPKPTDHEKEDLKQQTPSREWIERMADGEDASNPGGLMACNPELLDQLAAESQAMGLYDSEWPKVYVTEDGRTIAFKSEDDQPRSVGKNGDIGCSWRHSEALFLSSLGQYPWRLVSKGGKAVE